MSELPFAPRIPYDWWTIYHKLMREKDWTRAQIGRLTLNDLRVLTLEDAPAEPGDTLGGGGKVTTMADFEAVRAARRQEAESWPH